MHYKMFRVAFYCVLVIFWIQASCSDSVNRTRRMNLSGSCKCGQAGGSRRIINGHLAKPHAYPWMAQILDSGGLLACGASLISDRYVLTAAHCLEKSKIEDFKIGLGRDEINRNGDGYIREIKRIILHPGYHLANVPVPHLYNDIALIELREPLDFGQLDNVSPVCLPFNRGSNKFVGYESTVAGWGYTKPEGDPSEYLKETKFRALSNADCLERLRPDGIVDNEDICALGLEGGTICFGDSGSPLFTSISGQYEQIGVLAKGMGCEKIHLPSIYTRVTDYLDWIKGETQNSVYCA